MSFLKKLFSCKKKKDHKGMDYKVLAVFHNTMEAEIAVSKLHNEHIGAELRNNSSAFPSLSSANGIEVIVLEKDYNRASKVLAASDKAE